MKHIFALFIVWSVVALSTQAQDDKTAIKSAASTAASGEGRYATKLPDSLNWKKGGDISLNFSQTHLSDWTGGGEPSLSLSSSSNLYANYKKGKMIWENYAFLVYGIVKTGDRKAVKNQDQLNVGSRAGYQMSKKWYYTAALLGKTQFAPGYKSDTIRISNFLAPLSLYLSLGLDYKPSSNFSVSFAPAMGKATFAHSDDPVVLASSGISQELIDKGKKSRYEFGGGMVMNFNGDLFKKKVTYLSQLELFSNYLEKPQNVDVVWDFQFRVELTKFISASVRLNMIYDDNKKTAITRVNADGTTYTDSNGPPKLQVKEFFEIGLFYAFPQEK